MTADEAAAFGGYAGAALRGIGPAIAEQRHHAAAARGRRAKFRPPFGHRLRRRVPV
jgi:hypothetical protein